MYYLISLNAAGEHDSIDSFLLTGDLDAERLAIEVNARLAHVPDADDLHVSVRQLGLVPFRPGHTVAKTVETRLVPVAEEYGAWIRELQQQYAPASGELAQAESSSAPF